MTDRPGWRMVANDLRDLIKAGTLQPGEKLPSQPELAVRYGLNQTTVQRAINQLRHEGVIRVQRGVGAFVEDRDDVARRIIVDWLRNGYDDTDSADVQAHNLAGRLRSAGLLRYPDGSVSG